MAELPSGTVTFLFTDIEGSPRLLNELGRDYDAVLVEQQRILRNSFEVHNGREVDTQGDSFFAAFGSAGDAVASAAEAQQALADHPWPEAGEVRVRMGLHTGEPRPAGERYVGFGVHRAARIGAVGHGGQVLLSNATRELVEDELPPNVHIRELGTFELKDLDRPERLYQLDVDGLPSTFPPLKAPQVAEPRHVRRRTLLAALGGLGAVGKHLYVLAHPGFSCGIDPMETVLNKIPTATLLPWLFKAEGLCENATDGLFGLSIPQWSAVWFVLLTLALVWVLAAGRRTR